MNYFQNEKIHLMLCRSSVARMHSHSFLELAYVISGEAVHVANGVKMPLVRGDYFVIDYRTEHYYERIGEEEFAVINCLFLPEFIDTALFGCDSFEKLLRHYLIHMQISTPPLGQFPFLFHDEEERIYRLFSQMLEEYTEKKAGYVELLRSDLIAILILSLRQMTATTITQSPAILDACHYATEHCAEKITLGQVAARTHYSIPYFCRKFKTETGMHFVEYLEQVRATEACRLLADTNARITDIAARVGYRDIESFQRMFRRRCGMSPSTYRNQTYKR